MSIQHATLILVLCLLVFAAYLVWVQLSLSNERDCPVWWIPLSPGYVFQHEQLAAIKESFSAAYLFCGDNLFGQVRVSNIAGYPIALRRGPAGLQLGVRMFRHHPGYAVLSRRHRNGRLVVHVQFLLKSKNTHVEGYWIPDATEAGVGFRAPV